MKALADCRQVPAESVAIQFVDVGIGSAEAAQVPAACRHHIVK
jgi:hypothetical protein